MSNVLTDIMGFFKRKKFVRRPKDNDVVIVGVHEPADITGVASPVPIKDARLCTIADLRDPCQRSNWPREASEAGVFLGKVIIPDEEDPTQEPTCYYAFRRLKSLNLNLTVVENGSYIEFDTTAEENKAENVGSGQGVYKDKTGETLNFRSLTSNDASISITQSEDGNEIDFVCNNQGGGGLTCDDLIGVLNQSSNFAQFKENMVSFCQQQAVLEKKQAESGSES